MYLANDVIQNSKKKGPEYGKQFGTVLKKAFEIMGGDACGEKTRKSLNRLLTIWEERGVYPKEMIDEFKNALGSIIFLSFCYIFIDLFCLSHITANKYIFVDHLDVPFIFSLFLSFHLLQY